MSLTVSMWLVSLAAFGVGYALGQLGKKGAAAEAMLRGLDMGYSQAKEEYAPRRDTKGHFVHKSQYVRPRDSK